MFQKTTVIRASFKALLFYLVLALLSACDIGAEKGSESNPITYTIAPGYVGVVSYYGVRENCTGPDLSEGMTPGACTTSIITENNITTCRIYTLSDQFKVHEEAHCLGMKHGTWVRWGSAYTCTPVLAGGKTIWRIGQTMCVRYDGEYCIQETDSSCTVVRGNFIP